MRGGEQAYADAYLQANSPKQRRRGADGATELTPLTSGRGARGSGYRAAGGMN